MAAPLKAVKRMDVEANSVVFKGYKSGLTLIIPETGSFEERLQELKKNLEQSRDFFKGARVSLRTGGRILNDSEVKLLTRVIEEFGMVLKPPKVAPARKEDSGKVDETEESDSFIPTITVKKTVRSGQRIEFAGNLVIRGDVNPGAEVVASGDIIVLGRLRGTAHAGAQGDMDAQIIAFQLNPVQIRIGSVYNRAPESDNGSVFSGPEVARIRDGLIVVEKIR